jgi:CheY-like chemotaxis protein
MLVGIIGAAELLRRGKVAEGDRGQLLDLIVRTGHRAADLTGKLLTFSRRGRFQARLVDVHETIEDALAILARSIDKRVAIRRQFAAPAPMVRGDPAELESAILNLGINARDAMPQGGLLEISTSVCDLDRAACDASTFSVAPGAYVEIRVRDSGTGISQAIQPRIFEPFFTTKAQGMGTGLGLAAVYGAITEHGGAITVTSEVGKGTEFQILLPLLQGDAARVQATPQQPLDVSVRGTVLVIDDEAVIRQIAELTLRDMGYDVLTAEDGVVGVSLLEAHRDSIRVVLLDVNMPRMDGRECLKRLREIDPNLRIIVFSGFTEEAVEPDSVAQGGFVFLKKPFRREALVAALEGRAPPNRREPSQ